MASSFVLLFFFAFFWSFPAPITPGKGNGNPVILISFDGSPWDVLSRTHTPNFDSIVHNGVKSYVHNVFPTETFPNHYTIVTGLYPESHGIIGNHMYDPVWNASFSMANNESRWWEGGEPVWVTNEIQGSQSGLCFWPGYDVKIRRYFPSESTKGLGFGKPFLDLPSMNWTDRVDLILRWLKKPISFVALYFEEPDIEGHMHGMKSESYLETIRRNDKIIGYLSQKLEENGLDEKVNLIITSDHGMTDINGTGAVNFDKYVDYNLYTVWTWTGTRLLLNPRHPENRSALYDALKKAEASEKGKLTVYRKHEVPSDLHFANSRRVPEFVVIMSEGYLAGSARYGNWTFRPKNESHGSHGFLPSNKDMQPFFLARGPAFKKGYNAEPFDMVNIYPLICHVLGIEPAPNNGSLSKVTHLLSKPEPSSTETMTRAELAALVIGSLFAVGCCLAAVYLVYKRRSRMGYNLQEVGGNFPLMGDDSEEESAFL